MKKRNLILNDFHFKHKNGDYLAIINKWSHIYYTLDMYKMEDEEICYILADSYYKLNQFDNSLIYINKYLSYSKNKNEIDNESIKYYFLLKSDIYNKRSEILKQYKTLLTYVKQYNVKDLSLLKLLSSLEDRIYNKYIIFLNVILILIYVGIVSLNLIFKIQLITNDTAYLLFVIIGLVVFIYSFLFSKSSIKITKKIFRKIIKLTI